MVRKKLYKPTYPAPHPSSQLSFTPSLPSFLPPLTPSSRGGWRAGDYGQFITVCLCHTLFLTSFACSSFSQTTPARILCTGYSSPAVPVRKLDPSWVLHRLQFSSENICLWAASFFSHIHPLWFGVLHGLWCGYMLSMSSMKIICFTMIFSSA